MDAFSLVEALVDISVGARGALDDLEDWGPSGLREGQYRLDLAADEVAVGRLTQLGMRVLSEESGVSGSGRLLAVVDPIDGSTNAYRGLPMYSTSICVLDEVGAWVGVVVDHVMGKRFSAVRGEGAWCDGIPLVPSSCRDLSGAVIGVTGVLQAAPRTWQYRAFGCASLELCAVAEGTLDGYVPVGGASLRPWDYLAALLICVEAGAQVGEVDGLDPWIGTDGPRAPAAAATSELLGALLDGSGLGRGEP